VKSSWEEIQGEIARCQECVVQWPHDVCHPLSVGEIPTPPGKVRVLFVGVAPTAERGKNKGHHFYSSSHDNLRKGLFEKVLAATPFALLFVGQSLAEQFRIFHDAGFFFVHCAKIRPIRENAPPIECIRFCAQQHFSKELFTISPRAVCFLGKGNAGPVAKKIFGLTIDEKPVVAHFGPWTGRVVVAAQPVWSNDSKTKLSVEQLLA